MDRRPKHRPEKVWRVMTEPERLSEWFPVTVTPKLREGRAMELGFGLPAPSPTSTSHDSARPSDGRLNPAGKAAAAVCEAASFAHRADVVIPSEPLRTTGGHPVAQGTRDHHGDRVTPLLAL